MKDKLTKKKVHRFDYYGFLFEKKLYKDFLEYCADLHRDSSSPKVRHNYIKAKGLWYELTHSKYDARFVELVRIAKTPWLTD